MKYIFTLTSISPLYLHAHMDGIELSSFLGVLASMGLSYSLYLLYRIERVKKERDQALEKQKADANILYLQSRYASMGETLANIAHQWKQPLNAIGTIQNNIKANLIFQGNISKEKLLSNVETSFKLLQHLGETIDTFYGFLAQQHRPDGVFKISEPLETIRKITEYSLDNANIRLYFELESDPEITGCTNEFTHALLNLILNAKDAFDETDTAEPTITVRVRGDDQECSIEVIDNAGGIRLEPVDLVFSLHITSKTDGSGLGLFMTKKIIESRFGGKISAQNRNGGACFTVTLPYVHHTLESDSLLSPDDKANIEHINRLTHKVIELEEAKNTLTKWADIFQHAHWGIAIHIGTSNAFELFNPSFHALYGYSASEMKHLSVPDLFPEDTLLFLSKFQQKAFNEGYVAFETINRRKDGSLFPVSVELMALKNDEGEVLYHIANVWDQSEKKAAEELLLLKKFALDTINEAVYLIDENSMFHYVNDGACKALGYTKEELQSMGVVHIDPACSIGWWGIHWDDIKRLKTITGIASHKRKDGTVFPIEVSSNYFEFNGKGYSLAIARDITERLALEAQKEDERRERELRALADTSPGMMGAYHMRPDGSVCMPYASPNIYDLFGITPEEIKEDATPLMALSHPDDAEMIAQTIQESAQNMSLWNIEYRIIHPTKGERWMEGNTMPQPHPDGGIVWYGYVHDITERKRIEKELEDSHAFLTKLIDSLPDPIFVKDREHKWLILNKANYEFAGIEPGSLIGKSDYDFFPKEEADIFWEKDEEVFTSGNVNINEEYFTSADGATHYIQTIKAMFVGSDGKEYLVGTIRDLSERKEMEDELRKALEFNEGVIGAIPDLLFEIAPDSTYVGVWAQDETLLAAQKAILLGRKFKDILPPDAAEISFAAMREVDEKGFSIGKTFSLDLPNGKRWFELSLSKKQTSGNYIALSRDITERKRAEETIVQLNASLEDRVKERTHQLMKALEFNEGIINALPDLLFEVDREGRYLGVWANNPELLAAQKEILLNHSFEEILSPESTRIALEAIEEAEAKGLSFGKTIEIELSDGIHWFELSASKKCTEGTFLFISRDISERVKAEKALRKREEMFRAIVENSPDVISNYDLSMRRIYVNPMMQFLLGKPTEEILGKTPYEFSPLPDIENFEHLFHTVVEGKSEIEYESSYRTPWGEFRWGNQRIVPIFNDEHNVEGVMLIGRDITERFENEQRLKMLEAALNGSAEGIYINDRELNIIYVNDEACNMLGYTREEFMQMKITDIDADFSSEGINDLVERKILHKKIFFRTRHRTKEGTIIKVEISGSTFIHEENEIFVSVVKDVSAIMVS
jgi:PAS domain S-box-containing protein